MANVMPQDIFSTSRLVLRATVDEDIALLHEGVFSDPDVIRYVFSGRQFSRDESAAFVRARFNFAGADVGLSTLTERASGDVIGFSGLIRCNALGEEDLELGFVLAKRAWGNGYATEIGQAQIDFGFNHLRCSRLLALVDSENIRSINVLERLGLQHESDVAVEGRGQRRVYSIEA